MAIMHDLLNLHFGYLFNSTNNDWCTCNVLGNVLQSTLSTSTTLKHWPKNSIQVQIYNHMRYKQKGFHNKYKYSNGL